MAVTIVGTNPDAVIGGVDTHAEVHVAAVVNHVGGVLGVESFPTTIKGYRQLVSWLASHGELTLVGVEGTGSYGVGVARYLARAGIDVVEVDRPNRQTRHRKGKSDPGPVLDPTQAVAHIEHPYHNTGIEPNPDLGRTAPCRPHHNGGATAKA